MTVAVSFQKDIHFDFHGFNPCPDKQFIITITISVESLPK